jgi:hypothetical protein
MDNSSIREYLDSMSVKVPGGSEIIRMFKPGTDWISSDYHLSSPNLLHQTKEQTVETHVDSFMMLIYPMCLFILEKMGLSTGLTDAPKMFSLVQVSWDEAIETCNQISSLCGLEPCYTLDLHTGE